MSTHPIVADEYRVFIQDIKQRIHGAQIKAASAVNRELLQLYWDLAERIVAKQREAAWGDGFLARASRDLQDEFPGVKGFSERNLKYMRQWYLFWATDTTIGQQLVAQIPWGHNLLIVSKARSIDEAAFYVRQTLRHNWSRAVLTHQIESGLYLREGQAVTNFSTTLPAPQSDLARQTLKDPYVFDFLSLRERHDEKELENGLIEHVEKFLLELGVGFAFVGRQYPLHVGADDFYLDLLFYHLKLRCFVVIELKRGKFKPEHAGKVNFYCNVVDDKLRHEHDQPTIGLILCQDKNQLLAEYALKGIDKPIGISEYLITRTLPEELKSSLPSIEEIEAELGGRE